jgi:hypothetical protein
MARPHHRGLLLLCLLLAGQAAAAPAVGDAALAEFRRIAALAGAAPEQALQQAEAWRRRVEGGSASLTERRYMLRSLGAVQRSAGRYDQAAVAYSQALAIDDADPTLADALQFELGVTYGLAGLHAEALEAFRAALPGYQARADWQRVSGLLGNIGNELDAAGDIAGARDHYERALALKRQHGLDRGISGLLNNLADYDLQLGDAEAAARRLAEAITAAQAASEPEPASEAIARGNRVNALAALQRFGEAEAELAALDALSVSAQPRLRALREEVQATLLRARAAAPDRSAVLRQRQREAALASTLRALDIAAAIDEPRRRVRLLRLASDLAAELGDWQGALGYTREAERESLAQEQRQQRDRHAVLAARYQQARREQELAELRGLELAQRNDLGRQRLWLLLAASVIFLVLLLALLQRRRIRHQRRLEIQLQAHNRALGEALDRAETQRRRAEQLARSHTRLLRLAGDDLRAPVLHLRSLAERLLVGQRSDPALAPSLAALAESAAELMRVSEQMIETGAEALAAPADAEVDLAALLADLLEEAAQRAPTTRGALVLQPDSVGFARIDGSRLQLLLHELLQLLLADVLGGERRQLAVRQGGDHVDVLLDDPGSRLWRRLREEVEADAAPETSLGTLWIRRAIAALGAELDPVAGEPPRLRLRLHLAAQ